VSGAVGYIVAGWNEPSLPPWSFGYVVLPAFAGIVVASTAAAPLGARLATACRDGVAAHLRAVRGTARVTHAVGLVAVVGRRRAACLFSTRKSLCVLPGLAAAR